MAEDRKFKFEDGRFVNRVSGEAIPDDEPVIIFRARDVHALSTLKHYLGCCIDEHHRQVVLDRINEFTDFKDLNPHRMKEPGITHHMDLHSSRRPVHILIPENSEEDLHQGRRHESPIEERMDALERREHHVEKEMKDIMADIDTLNGILSDIGNDASMLKDDFKNLEAELQAAQEAAANNQPIDLTNSILMARNAQAALDAVIQAAAVGAAPSGDITGGTAGDTAGASAGGTAGNTGGAPTGDTGGVPAGDTGGAPAGDTGGAPAGDTDGTGTGV